ncbi:11653_t:CDS:2, partial [Funneliformis mosseae]
LSYFLINNHKYDFLPILAELPKDSKVVSKIMNFTVVLMKDLMQEKEKVELSKHITNLENIVKHCTELLLRSKGICNVRGALEFIRSTDKIISFRESTDNVLTRLTQDAKFISYLKQTCLFNNSQYKDVERCMGGLYHTASKKLHSHDKDIEIDA